MPLPARFSGLLRSGNVGGYRISSDRYIFSLAKAVTEAESAIRRRCHRHHPERLFVGPVVFEARVTLTARATRKGCATSYRRT